MENHVHLYQMLKLLGTKKNQPLTSQQFKLSMFATTSNKEPEPKKNVSDNASRTKLQNTLAEKSIEREDPNTQPVKKVVIGDGSLERQQIMEKKSIENDTSRSKEQSRRITKFKIPERGKKTDKLQESIENSVESGTQAFQSLFGKENPGRVRCYGRTVTPSLLKKNEEIYLMKMQYDSKISDMAQKMGAMEALLKSMDMQQNPHLSEVEVDDKMRETLHNDNIPTPRSSTSTYAPAHQKFYKLLIKLMVRNKDDPQDEQDDDLQDDDDLQYDQDDDDLQYDQDDNDLQYDNFQDDDSHESQHNEYDKDRH
ncbi:uncharacterized protein LOC127122578 [Lathyrus oleraceus]|uniref:uncharacterized protein LOC127122578 n=1 Tax=Pisum sativum TaxID=3888 RepID=UPI0021D20076|nr:uncharacterized protein LOC127122578 [Pisum sativum]